MITVNDHERRVFEGRLAGGSWCRNTGLVCVTLSVERNKIKTRSQAKDAALKATEGKGFPEWRPTATHRTKMTPGLCLVVGEVVS